MPGLLDEFPALMLLFCLDQLELSGAKDAFDANENHGLHEVRLRLKRHTAHVVLLEVDDALSNFGFQEMTMRDGWRKTAMQNKDELGFCVETVYQFKRPRTVTRQVASSKRQSPLA